MVRVNLNVIDETHKRWKKFQESSKFSTLSQLIRESVEIFISSYSKTETKEALSKNSHELRGELSSIKGFSQMLIEEYKDELSWDVLLKIKEIYDKSVNIEKILNKVLNTEKIMEEIFDVLIVEDDDSTVHLLSDFLKRRGYTSKRTSTLRETMMLLKHSVPKFVLIDVLLPDSDDGYKICRKIKADDRLKQVPVYYITAVPETEVSEKTKETGASGYFLKPFNMSDFNTLLNIS